MLTFKNSRKSINEDVFYIQVKFQEEVGFVGGLHLKLQNGASSILAANCLNTDWLHTTYCVQNLSIELI
jgi:hypothetical protein